MIVWNREAVEFEATQPVNPEKINLDIDNMDSTRS